MRAGSPGHALAVGAGAIALAGVSSVWQLSWSQQLWLVLPWVVVLGLPHGAADLLVADRFLRPPGGRVGFVAGYLAAAVLATAVWLRWPEAALLGFLALSALHFALTDRQPRRHLATPSWPAALAQGAIPVVAVAWFHPSEVAVLFSQLIPGPDAAAAASGAQIQAWAAAPFPVLCGALAWAALREWQAGRGSPFRRRLARSATGSALLAIAAAPPLLGFALYFCAWHATLHNAALLDRLRSIGVRDAGRVLARAMVGPWLATLALGACAWMLLPGGSAAQTAARIAFVGLAALTVPHVLVWAWDQGAPRVRRVQILPVVRSPRESARSITR